MGGGGRWCTERKGQGVCTNMYPPLLPLFQLRELHYKLEQERESRHSSEVVGAQLREQLERAERKVSQTMEGRQAAELQRRELEIEHRSFKITNQQVTPHTVKIIILLKNQQNFLHLSFLLHPLPPLQLQDEVVNLTTQLQKERDARGLQEGLYKEQIK